MHGLLLLVGDGVVREAVAVMAVLLLLEAVVQGPALLLVRVRGLRLDLDLRGVLPRSCGVAGDVAVVASAVAVSVAAAVVVGAVVGDAGAEALGCGAVGAAGIVSVVLWRVVTAVV